MTEVDTDVVLGQRYRLVRRIAVGGMGSVWEAEDTVLHRPVAVKLLSDSLSADRRFADRFRREAQAAARLSHPNIASVFDYGEDDGHQFIVMELVDGEPLSERLAEAGRLDPDEAVRITVGIAAALQAAHESGIVHRDVKPGNVMLDGSGQVKVLDFGIAAAAGAPLTATGARMGTATYISPEQSMGEPPSPASDVYSLGVVLYEMLAGRPPFTADTPVGVAAQHVQRQPPPLGEIAPDVPFHVAQACQQALAKDPSMRPASAASFAAMLASPQGAAAALTAAAAPRGPDATMILPPVEPTAVLDPEPAPATPSPGRPARPARRSLVPWALAAMIVALGVLALVLALTHSGARTPPSNANQIKVPDVTGMKLDEAEQAIGNAGLIVGEAVGTQGKHDVVIRTDPAAGASVSPGSTVTLYVGAAPHGGGNGNGGGEGNGGKGSGGGD